MKYFKRLKLWKSKNLVLDPATMKSTSYDWWMLTGKVSGVVIFNTYKYSVTTAKHIDKVFCTLHDLGIRDYLEIQSPSNITLYSTATIEHAIKWQMGELDELLVKHNAPRARANPYSGAAGYRRIQITRMAQNLVNLHKVAELIRNRNLRAEAAADQERAVQVYGKLRQVPANEILTSSGSTGGSVPNAPTGMPLARTASQI